ncbi:hypothetical protein ACVWYF_003638 [Hymenobacter sp. UYAg731]
MNNQEKVEFTQARAQKKAARRAAFIQDVAKVAIALQAGAPAYHVLAAIAGGDYDNLVERANTAYYDELCAELPPHWRAFYAEAQARKAANGWKPGKAVLPEQTRKRMGPVIDQWAKNNGLIVTDEPG